MHTSAKSALGTYTNLAAKCKVLPEDSEYIEISGKYTEKCDFNCLMEEITKNYIIEKRGNEI